MASPQTENGYTKIANELLEALCRFGLKGSELAVVFWIARLSYGWSARKTKKLSLRGMARDMDRPQASICLAVQVLIEKKVLVRDEKGRYSINKNYEEWLNAAQPVGQKVPSPLGTLPSPLGTLPSPLGNSAQPVGHFHDEPKERKKLKESVKGENDQNGDTHTPSLGEIMEYSLEIGKHMDCRRFFDHYTANGWTRGKSQIADWKAVLRLWSDDGSPAPISTKPLRPKNCERCFTVESHFKSDVTLLWLCQNCLLAEGVTA